MTSKAEQNEALDQVRQSTTRNGRTDAERQRRLSEVLAGEVHMSDTAAEAVELYRRRIGGGV